MSIAAACGNVAHRHKEIGGSVIQLTVFFFYAISIGAAHRVILHTVGIQHISAVGGLLLVLDGLKGNSFSVASADNVTHQVSPVHLHVCISQTAERLVVGMTVLVVTAH